jgi:phosphotriesterase-related protein
MHVNTYRGAVDVADLGRTLMHEHIFVMAPELMINYPGYADWDEESAVCAAVTRLTDLKQAGIDTIVDLTVTPLGRNPPLIQRVARACEVNIVGATGIYVTNELPEYLKFRGPGLLSNEPEPLVELFVHDIEHGMADTGVRAGILKCATDRHGLTPDVERTLRAVAQAHLRTGVPITTHTHAGREVGLVQQRVFAEEGVSLDRVIIGHSGDTVDLDYLQRLLEAGSYLGMDRFGFDVLVPFAERVRVVAELCRRGYAERLVLSHDAVCHHDAVPAQKMRALMPNYHMGHISADVIPALVETGVPQEQIDQMLVGNPARILGRCA